MLNIKYSNNTLEIKGHANFAKYGKDIVCAAVSSIVTYTINLIDSFSKLNKINYKLDEGYLYIKILDIKDNELKIIFNTLIESIINISNSYPKNIKITEDNSNVN